MSSAPTDVLHYTVLRPQQLRDVNEAAVLRYLLGHEPTSRSEIARGLGLTQGSVTKIVSRLVARGLLLEVSIREQDSGRGRPKVPLDLVKDAYVIAGAHIGVQHLTLGVTGIDGVPVDTVRVDHDGTWTQVHARIAEWISQVRVEHHPELLGLGLIIGGQVDPERGTLLAHAALGWHDVPLREDLARSTGAPVHVDSSARAHAEADLVFGTSGAARNFLHVFVGNVVEVAVVAEGRVQPGRDGGAGDITGMAFKSRREGFTTIGESVSDVALLRRARLLGLISQQDGLDQLVAEADGPGGAMARGLLLDRAADVGRVLAQLDALLAPELIVLSSGVLAVEEALPTAAAALVEARAPFPAVPLLPARYGTNPLITAAATLVLEHSLLSPMAR